MSGDYELLVWAIFDSPRDLPGHIVVRAFAPQRDGTVLPAREAQAWEIGSDKEGALESARRYCAARAPTRLERHPGDDPNIVETWL